MKDFFDDLKRRDERTRTDTINEVEYTIVCTDPYSHWHILHIPKAHPLSGQTWTSSIDAWKAIRSYEEARKMAKKTLSKPTITKE